MGSWMDWGAVIVGIEKLKIGYFSGKLAVLGDRMEGYWLGKWENGKCWGVGRWLDLAIWWGIAERGNGWKMGEFKIF